MVKTISSELIVACEIYLHNQRKEPIWFGKLVDVLSDEMSKNVVSESLDTLSDWMITKGHYGETVKGRAGYLLEIEEIEIPKIADIQRIRELKL